MMTTLSPQSIGRDFVEDAGARLERGKAAFIAEIDEQWQVPLDTRMEALGGKLLRQTRTEIEDAYAERAVRAAEGELAALEAEITCYPFHQWLVRRTGRAAFSALVTSALMVLAVVVPLVFIGDVAVHQLFSLRDSLRQVGVPAAALWGLVTMFASMVPFVGTAAVWVPGTVYLLASGSWLKAIVLAVWGAAVVSSVDNFLRPKLVAGRVRLSGVAMFVAMLGGLQAFGALGIILGPVLFATAAAILDGLRETQPSRARRAEASERKVG